MVTILHSISQSFQLTVIKQIHNRIQLMDIVDDITAIIQQVRTRLRIYSALH
jgi:hypothetical protein